MSEELGAAMTEEDELLGEVQRREPVKRVTDDELAHAAQFVRAFLEQRHGREVLADAINDETMRFQERLPLATRSASLDRKSVV